MTLPPGAAEMYCRQARAVAIHSSTHPVCLRLVAWGVALNEADRAGRNARRDEIARGRWWLEVHPSCQRCLIRRRNTSTAFCPADIHTQFLARCRSGRCRGSSSRTSCHPRSRSQSSLPGCTLLGSFVARDRPRRTTCRLLSEMRGSELFTGGSPIHNSAWSEDRGVRRRGLHSP